MNKESILEKISTITQKLTWIITRTSLESFNKQIHSIQKMLLSCYYHTERSGTLEEGLQPDCLLLKRLINKLFHFTEKAFQEKALTQKEVKCLFHAITREIRRFFRREQALIEERKLLPSEMWLSTGKHSSPVLTANYFINQPCKDEEQAKVSKELEEYHFNSSIFNSSNLL